MEHRPPRNVPVDFLEPAVRDRIGQLSEALPARFVLHRVAEAPEEHALFAALDTAEAAIAPAMNAEDFATAMSAMASLRAPIDAFFTAVQVNADSPMIRRNRLNLLSRIRAICLSVADLTKIEG